MRLSGSMSPKLPLKYPWVHLHNPHIDWATGFILCWSPACHQVCLKQALSPQLPPVLSSNPVLSYQLGSRNLRIDALSHQFQEGEEVPPAPDPIIRPLTWWPPWPVRSRKWTKQPWMTHPVPAPALQIICLSQLPWYLMCCSGPTLPSSVVTHGIQRPIEVFK